MESFGPNVPMGCESSLVALRGFKYKLVFAEPWFPPSLSLTSSLPPSVIHCDNSPAENKPLMH